MRILLVQDNDAPGTYQACGDVSTKTARSHICGKVQVGENDCGHTLTAGGAKLDSSLHGR
jgi:hypothetical protein